MADARRHGRCSPGPACSSASARRWSLPGARRAWPVRWSAAAAPGSSAAGCTVRVSGELRAACRRWSSPLTLVLGAALLAPLVALRAPRRVAPDAGSYETWGCGRMLQTARMEYTATAFAESVQARLRLLLPAREAAGHRGPSRVALLRASGSRTTNPARSIFEEWLYGPALAALRAIVARVRRVQSGSANALPRRTSWPRCCCSWCSR